MSIRSLIRRADERRRELPVGVQILTAFAVASIALFGLVLFGPELPGPNVTELVDGTEEAAPLLRCDPNQSELRKPDQPVDVSGRWREEDDMPFARDELRAAAAGGRIFILNGQTVEEDGDIISIGEAWEYDPATGKYSRIPDTPVAVDHAAAVTYRGDVYLVGGDSNDEPTGGLWRYSPRAQAWEELPPMQNPRAGHAAAVIGDRLYVVGGTSDSGFAGAEEQPLSSLEIYDFRTGEWSQGSDMPTPRHHMSAAELDGRLYAIGGRMPGDFSLDVVERFDPASGEWEEIAPLPLGTGGPSAVTAGGMIVVAGGGDDITFWVTPATWGYDPEDGGWRRLPDLRVPRHGQASAVVGDRVYIFGGAPCGGYGRTARAESLSIVPSRESRSGR